MDKQLLQRIGIWVGVLVALGLMVWGLASLGAQQSTVADGGVIQDPVTASDHAKGTSLATNTLVEYSDFQCPACASYYPVVKQIAATYGGRLLIVYRHYPLTSIHQNAQVSAQAAEAAGMQGKFWEMHDMLFEHQKDWSQSNDAQNIFVGYATTLGLNKDQFLSDIASKTAVDKVKKDLDSGNRANVNSTPSFFLNGKKLTNMQTYGDLENTIKDTLK